MEVSRADEIAILSCVHEGMYDFVHSVRAIFKSGNGECANGNGERGIFKMGNL